MKLYLYIYVTTPPRGFSGPVQLNGIGRMHVKAPLAAANGVNDPDNARSGYPVSRETHIL